MTDSSSRFFQKGLTGFRALAALWVMVFHFNAVVGPKRLIIDLAGYPIKVTPLVTCGWVGIDLFFVLSGFLLTTHLLEVYTPERERAVFADYFKARMLRVFPAYWFQLAVLLFIALYTTAAWPNWWKHLPLHMFMLHNFLGEESQAINAVYWTLPVEFGFYICLPFIFKFILPTLRRDQMFLPKVGALVALTVVAAISYRYLIFHALKGNTINSLALAMGQFPGMIDLFVIGAGAAIIMRALNNSDSRKNKIQQGWLSNTLAVIGLSGVIGMMYFLDHVFATYWSGHWLLFVWHSITALFIALVICAIALSGPITRLLFENRATVFLGSISYSIYLWHFPITIWFAQKLDMPHTGLIRFSLIVAPVVILVSTISYYLVEKPFLGRKDKLLARRQPDTTT